MWAGCQPRGKTGLLPHTALNLTSPLRMWGKGWRSVRVCVGVCTCTHVVARVKVSGLCFSKCIFWLLTNPKVRERKTILISLSFCLVHNARSCFACSPLWSVLHLSEEKVTFHRKCNKHVEKTTISHWHSGCTFNTSW